MENALSPKLINWLRFGIPALMLIALIGWGAIGYSNEAKKQATRPPVKTITPTPVPRVAPTHTPTPTPTPPPVTPYPTTNPRTRISIAVYDFSKGRATDRILDISVKLYTKDGVFIGENKPNTLIKDGPVSTGGNAEFEVPYGSYRAEAEKDAKKGSIEFTLSSPKDDIGYTIYLKASALKISGRFFLDSNKNTQYDAGEQIFADKQVRAIVDTEGTLYTAYETKTDSNGMFEMYPSIFGKYLITTEQVGSYHAPPEVWIDLSGARSVTRDVYVWE